MGDTMQFINKIFKFLEKFLIISIAILSLIVLINFVQLNILKKEYTNFFGYSIFKVISDSMAPTIKKNDIIVVKIKDDIKINDVITYKLNGDFITHRVTSIEKDSYLTMGDSNNIGDKPVPKSTVVGKVTKVFPKLGIWRDILMTPKIFILLFFTIVLFSSSFKDWTKKQYNKFKDFKITNDSIIESCSDNDEKE